MLLDVCMCDSVSMINIRCIICVDTFSCELIYSLQLLDLGHTLAVCCAVAMLGWGLL